ncbi:uncharacterized protein LOC129312519 [Prosopis cineraria]|uniref:uncharacterized protein LOC129312519 n=1 Tax=Prosopis cineraria TaxID=364024 RepID=UPI00240F1B6B|nr:uncharacterized protein LOC129312519 [Prosopis cineraria]
MAASSLSSPKILAESVCEEVEFFEASNILDLMALMEETQEDHQYCEDDHRLLSMIQSLEAEIIGRSNSPDPYQRYDIEVGQVDGEDFSTSSIYWEDMEAASPSSSLSSFDDEMMDAWSLCAAGGDDSSSQCSSEFYWSFVRELPATRNK